MPSGADLTWIDWNVESLIEHPAIMAVAWIPPANPKRLGVSDGLIRLSGGVEDAADLRREPEHALSSSE